MNCLRCGRKTPDGAAFCEECAPRVREPLQTSPYLSARILLPERRSAGQKKPDARETRRAERSKRAQPLLLPVILLALLCVVLAGLCVCFAVGWLAPL